MKNVQIKVKNSAQLEESWKKIQALDPNLIFIFGTVDAFGDNGLVKQVCSRWPQATIIGCSTAGEISNDGVTDGTMVVTACHVSKPDFKSASAVVPSMADTKNAGLELGRHLKKEGLSGVFVLGKGLDVNGSALIDGLREVCGAEPVITGGLAGDGGKFQKTFAVINGQIFSDRVVALGIYHDCLGIAFGSMGGWEPFGPARKITKATANVLFELDGKPALDVYKTYLGDKAKELPGSALLFPLAIVRDSNDQTGIIRTVLGVSEADQSITFAGDLPLNGVVRLMHASNDGLVNGAREAAENVLKMHPDVKDGVGICISCVGRKLLMGDDVENELDAVNEVFGKGTLTGFYSYGEICPERNTSDTKLHNQTMTITYFYEKKAA